MTTLRLLGCVFASIALVLVTIPAQARCPIDDPTCGNTLPVCGDGSCDSPESCTSCPIDCGACPPTTYCGDGICNGGETCSICQTDCPPTKQYVWVPGSLPNGSKGDIVFQEGTGGISDVMRAIGLLRTHAGMMTHDYDRVRHDTMDLGGVIQQSEGISACLGSEGSVWLDPTTLRRGWPGLHDGNPGEEQMGRFYYPEYPNYVGAGGLFWSGTIYVLKSKDDFGPLFFANTDGRYRRTMQAVADTLNAMPAKPGQCDPSVCTVPFGYSLFAFTADQQEIDQNRSMCSGTLLAAWQRSGQPQAIADVEYTPDYRQQAAEAAWEKAYSIAYDKIKAQQALQCPLSTSPDGPARGVANQIVNALAIGIYDSTLAYWRPAGTIIGYQLGGAPIYSVGVGSDPKWTISPDDIQYEAGQGITTAAMPYAPWEFQGTVSMGHYQVVTSCP